MQTVDVCRKESGKIWHRKPSPTSDDGLVLTITHSVTSALSEPTRNVRFLHAAFDVSGDRFVAGDYQGNIYLFDTTRNRFSLTQKTGTPCTAIAFTLRRRTEFLVAMSDYSLKCFDTDAKELVAWMKGHEAAIHTISIHASGRYALTSSSDTAQLWDLDTFQRRRKLNIKENVGIVRVFFLPMSNTILTCFKDDSIFAWEADTLNCKYQLRIPEGKVPHFKAFATTRDGRLLVAGGRSRYLHMWALDTRKLLRIIQLPAKITAVKQLEFLPDSFDGGANQILGVLAQDGIMRFININTCKQVFDVGSLDNRINNVTISSKGRHIVAVMDSGNINMYNVQALTSELNQPPPPLVKVLKSNKMADTSGAAQERPAKRSAPGRRSRKGKENKSLDTQSTAKTESELPEGLSMSRLMAILKGYGEYPAKYRMFIWRSILRLPENHTAYAALVDKGTHPSYEKLHEQYPIKSRKLLRVLQRTLSALAHWSPIFGETDFLPMLAFPFIKLFQNNQLVCFEIIATILVNWCQHWFEYFPNPPINVLGMIENILAFQDKELLHHLVKNGVTSQMYAWPILETMFSEVLTREEWLKVFDNIFSNHPSFTLALVAAYCTCSRGPLLHCSELDDFKFFFHHRNAVDVGQVIKEAYRIMETTPENVHPQGTLEDFSPLTKGQYPVFNKYPKFIVDYQVAERERIRQEEVEYLRQRTASLEMQKETERRREEEEAWYRQQQLLTDAEEKRRKLIADEEQKLTDHRTRLAAMNRELKLKEMQLLDATRRKFMHYQQTQKETELARMDDEIRRKALLRDVETQAAIDDAEIRNLELQLKKKQFEMELHREHVEASTKQRQEYEIRRKQQELEDRVAQGLNRSERDKEQQVRQEFQENLAHAEQLGADATLRNQVEYRHQLDDLDRERKAVQLAKLQNQNRMLERSVHDLMKEVQLQKELDAQKKYAELDEQQSFARESEMRRLQLLEDDVNMARRHIQHVETSQDEMLERLHELRQNIKKDNLTAAQTGQNRFLNDTSSTEQSTQFSLDRGRQTFENQEQELMAEVRRLRTKLAKESRDKKPPAKYQVEL